jgi:hypothetical protein
MIIRPKTWKEKPMNVFYTLLVIFLFSLMLPVVFRNDIGKLSAADILAESEGCTNMGRVEHFYKTYYFKCDGKIQLRVVK